MIRKLFCVGGKVISKESLESLKFLINSTRCSGIITGWAVAWILYGVLHSWLRAQTRLVFIPYLNRIMRVYQRSFDNPK